MPINKIAGILWQTVAMKNVTTTLDVLSGPALAVLGFLNIAFLAAFFVTLSVLGARAGMPVCSGQDLLAAMATDDPGSLAEIRVEAAKVPNGTGLLWKIEKPGTAPSWLFGTMHVTDPRVVDLTPQARAAFEEAATVVIEATDAVDPQQAALALAKRPDLTMFTDGTTLTALLDDEQEALVAQALEKRGIPLAAVNLMKPWIVATAVALPACEMARKQAGAPFLDARLAHDAKASGKTLGGLETMIGQLEAMNSLPVELHVEGLVDTLALGNRLDDMIETMIVLYKREETGMIWPLLRAVSAKAGDADDGYAAFEETMVTARNRTMAENAGAFLDKGNAFIAVGALHLPGNEGLVELLRQAGYRVTPAG